MKIMGIGTATPGRPVEQDELLGLASRFNADTAAQRSRLERIYAGTAVLRRHSVLTCNNAESPSAIQGLYDFYANDQLPGTSERMLMYERHALPLAKQACRDAFTHSATAASEVTHLVTVSCTGFASPGWDLGLIERLGLPSDVARAHIGFMGCHGAINALRVADALSRADPNARVLLCCVELCTLHFQYGTDPQDAVANALFADGAAAAVIGADSARYKPATTGFASRRITGTEAMMGWRISDQGFRMRLESRVPDIIGESLEAVITEWLSSFSLEIQAIKGWIIHPGGPRVLDTVEAVLGLSADQTRPARSILANYGNMSSPSVLFIMEKLLRDSIDRPWLAMAFGPGLSIELALIT